jgi:hypothetical protein
MRPERGQGHAIASRMVQAFDQGKEGLCLLGPVICEIVADQLLDLAVNDGEIEL